MAPPWRGDPSGCSPFPPGLPPGSQLVKALRTLDFLGATSPTPQQSILCGWSWGLWGILTFSDSGSQSDRKERAWKGFTRLGFPGPCREQRPLAASRQISVVASVGARVSGCGKALEATVRSLDNEDSFANPGQSVASGARQGEPWEAGFTGRRGPVTPLGGNIGIGHEDSLGMSPWPHGAARLEGCGLRSAPGSCPDRIPRGTWPNVALS